MQLRLPLFLLMGFLFGCSNGSDSYSMLQPDDTPGLDEFGRVVVPGHVLEDSLDAQNPLAFHQVAVLYAQESREGDSGGAGYDEVWFEYLQSREVNFCVDADADSGQSLRVLNADDEQLLQVDSGSCARLQLTPGRYLKRVYLGNADSGLVFVHGSFKKGPTTAVVEAVQAGASAVSDTDSLSTLDIQLRRLVANAARANVSEMTVSTRSCVRCNLANIMVEDMDLDGIDLEAANLSSSTFSNVSMKGALLDGVSGQSATLDTVDLQFAALGGTDFSSATLTSVNFNGIDTSRSPRGSGYFVSAPDATGANRGDKGGYLMLAAVTEDGSITSKLWDGYKNRGWESGFAPLPSLPSPALSSPGVANNGTEGNLQAAYLAEDATLWSTSRVVGGGWSDWYPLGRPAGQQLLSGPLQSQAMRKPEGNVSGGWYLAVLAEDEAGANAPQVWLRTWYNCGGSWSVRVSDDTCVDYYQSPSDGVCVGAVDGMGAPFSAGSGSDVWCPLGAPSGGAASAPALAYLAPLDVVVTVVGADGKLYERGIGNNNSTGTNWREVAIPDQANFTIAAAPAAGYAGSESTVLLSLLAGDGSLWIGSRSVSTVYSWTKVIESGPAQVEVLYAPALANYGRSDRSYYSAVVRNTDLGDAGQLAGESYFFQNSSLSQACCEFWGYPGGSYVSVPPTSFANSTMEKVQMGFDLGNVNLSDAQILDSVFADASVFQVDFGGTDLSGSDFSGVDLSNAQLQGADLSDADLSDTTLDGLAFGQLMGASACGASEATRDDATVTCLDGTKFFGASMHGTDFAGADLRTAQFDKWPKIDTLADSNSGVVAAASCTELQPQPSITGGDPEFRLPSTIQRTSLRGAKFTPGQFLPIYWRSLDLTGAAISAAETAALSNINYDNIVMTAASITSTTGAAVDFSGSSFRSADLRMVNMDGHTLSSKISSSCFYNAQLDGASFKGAALDNAQLLSVSANTLTDKVLGAQDQPTIFDEASLVSATMIGSSFEGASFGKAKLRSIDASGGGVSFRGANLSHATLYKANLSDAVFSATDTLPPATLRSAFLNAANLSGADFSGADLSNVYMSGAAADPDGEGVTLTNTNFTRANLSGAYMVYAVFNSGSTSAQLQGVNLEGAVLVGADLQFANLSSITAGADRPSNLSNTRLEGANLQGADLQGAILTDAQVCVAAAVAVGDDPVCSGGSIPFSPIVWDTKTMQVAVQSTPVKFDESTNLDGAKLGGAICPSSADATASGCDGSWQATTPPPTIPPDDPNSWN